MTQPPHPPPRTRHTGGLLAGIAAALFGVPFAAMFAGYLGSGIGLVGAALAGVVLAFVALTRPDPFWRSFGVGMLTTFAVLLLLVGACVALVLGSLH